MVINLGLIVGVDAGIIDGVTESSRVGGVIVVGGVDGLSTAATGIAEGSVVGSNAGVTVGIKEGRVEGIIIGIVVGALDGVK